MQHMLQPNLAAILPRRVETAIPWSHVFLSSYLVEHVAVSLKTIDYCFPLYLYKKSDSGGSGGRAGVSKYQTLFVFEPAAAYSVRHPNINADLVTSLSTAYKKPPSPEHIFHYIYAVLYSHAYRRKYAEFLKIDFPRVPFTKDSRLFHKLAEKGEELVALHLLRSNKLAKPISKCEGSGSLMVEKVTYDPKRGAVHINPDQWFTGVSPEVWEYHIGGYQVAEKWLKDRKGRILSSEEVVHYCRVITALAETIKIQQSIDDIFEGVERNLLEVHL